MNIISKLCTDRFGQINMVFVIDLSCFSGFFFRELSDTIMNVVGAFMWVSVGATALHYWQGYMADHDQLVVVRERTVCFKCFHFELFKL